MDSRICQTSTASPAKPGGLPLTLGYLTFAVVRLRPRALFHSGERLGKRR